MSKGLEIDCDMALAQLWDYLDEELTPDRMAAIRVHLERCSHCLPHAIFGERFLKALRDSRGDAEMPDGLRSKVVAKLRQEGLLS